MNSDEKKAIGELLAGLLNDESALYAITREWRYDTVGRKFLRLHALLDEQFSEIGLRLTRLAARSRDLGSWTSTGHGERAAPPRAAVAVGALQAHMIRELLSRHEALIASLKRGSVLASGRFHDRETTDLLAEFTANHEKDAFMLRALLWEVENITR
jgi:starvation-inducible DNA-binding protein